MVITNCLRPTYSTFNRNNNQTQRLGKNSLSLRKGKEVIAEEFVDYEMYKEFEEFQGGVAKLDFEAYKRWRMSDQKCVKIEVPSEKKDSTLLERFLNETEEVFKKVVAVVFGFLGALRAAQGGMAMLTEEQYIEATFQMAEKHPSIPLYLSALLFMCCYKRFAKKRIEEAAKKEEEAKLALAQLADLAEELKEAAKKEEEKAKLAQVAELAEELKEVAKNEEFKAKLAELAEVLKEAAKTEEEKAKLAQVAELAEELKQAAKKEEAQLLAEEHKRQRTKMKDNYLKKSKAHEAEKKKGKV